VSVTVVVAVLFCVGRLVDHGRLAACAEHRRVQLVEQFRCAALLAKPDIGLARARRDHLVHLEGPAGHLGVCLVQRVGLILIGFH
jgi:hypothetical protein